MMLHFEHAWLLPLAAVIGAGTYILNRKITASVMIASIIVAISCPYIVKNDLSQKTIFLIDRSESMKQADLRGQINRLSGLLPEKAEIYYVDFAKSRFDPDFEQADNHTDIESALFYSMSFIRQNGRIYLFSDMLQTRGNLDCAVNEMNRRNISLDIIVPKYKLEKEVILSEVNIPEYLTQNQSAAFEVKIESAVNCTGFLEVTNKRTNEKQIESIELDEGFNSFLLPIDTDSDYLDYVLTVNSEQDTHSSNNTHRIQAEINEKPLVAIMGSEYDYKKINSILSKYARTVYLKEKQIPYCDLLIMADGDRETITESFAAKLKQKISEGMGFLVLPGGRLLKDNLFAFDYFSDLLPAKLHQQNKKSSPDGCIVFIVDTSGSMQGTRLILAKGIVRSSMERLSAYDKVGIVEFYGNRKWAAPIQSAANRIDLNRAVNRLTAGGGTVILPAIEEAYYGLLNIEAAAKHIVVISDGGIESADYESVLRRIRNDNINVSFVMTGPSAHTGFLSEMSMYGGGKFLHSPDRFSIPEIDIKTLSGNKTGPFRQNIHTPGAQGSFELLEGIDLSELPVDFRYIPADSKLSANTVLQTGQNPLLTSWNVGLGKVILSNSNLFPKESTQKLFQNICRWLYRQPETASALKNEAFEIKSCRPDYALAEKTGRIKQSGHIDQITTLDLGNYFLLISFICFIARIVIRRLPGHAAVFTVLVIGCCYAYGGYPETMKKGIDLYYKNDFKSLDKFIEAYKQSTDRNDKKYSLAWALLASQKNGRFNDFEEVLLDSPDRFGVACLNTAYALSGDFDSARELRRIVESDDGFNLKDKKLIDRQLVDIAIVSRQFDSAIQYYEDHNDITALMKIHLLKGDRDKALKAVSSRLPENLCSSELFEVCLALRQMGFNNLVLDKVKTIQSRCDEYYYEATEFIFELYVKDGQMDKAVEAVLRAVDKHMFTDKQLFEMGILLEKAGKTGNAIEIHKEVYKRTEAIDCLMRIAVLEETRGNFERSYKLWYDIWEQCNQPFMLYQIIPRMLDMAARTDSLVDLVIKLEDRLSADLAGSKEVDLLIDIYIAVKDSFAPIEIVKQYYGNDTIQSLKRQYRIYRKCRLYGKCARVLKNLIELDLENQLEYLQQMAITAVERSDHVSALDAAERLKRAGGELEPEFTAGLLSMIGRYEDAMKAYEELIYKKPDNNELWLLWAQQAANCSEQTRQTAIDRLSGLLNPDADDDRFLAAADALLNLDASKEVLKGVYAKTLQRIEAAPEKVYFYRLAIDILSEIDPSASHVELLLAAGCYAPDRRMTFVREAMNLHGDLSPRRFDLARLLVYMDWQCSPDQYIKLGQKFLQNGESKLAEYLFRCNSLLNAENKGLFLTIADVYQRRSDFNEALTIVLEALALYPEDLQILIEAASYYEILGDYDNAYKLYSRAYSFASRQVELSGNQKKSKNISRSHDKMAIAFEGMIITSSGKLPEQVEKAYQQKMSIVPKPEEKKTAVRRRSARSGSKDSKTLIDLNMIDIELEEIIAGNSTGSKIFYRIDSILYDINEEQAEYLYKDFSDYSLVMGRSVLEQYLRAGLAHKAGRPKEAQDIIKDCYFANPQNRKIEFKLKKIMEAGRLYRELADIFVKITETNARSPHFWREITRLYYMAGDMEKAKWANSYASGQNHFVLQLVDYLFLYTKEQDIEKMKQYFRKYQIECRKKNKHFPLKWNYWDNLPGDGKAGERESVYMVLSRYPQLLEEFERYSRAVYPDRRDKREYDIAYKNCKAQISEQNNENYNTRKITR